MRTIIIWLMLFLTAMNCFAATAVSSQTAVWELNSAGNNVANSGLFDPGKTPAISDLACTAATSATPDCTSATYTFLAADAGDYLYVASGTNWLPGWYPIFCSAGTAGFGSGDTSCAAGHIHLYAGTTLSNSVAPIVTVAASQPSPQYKITTTQGVASVASPTAGSVLIDYSQAVGSRKNNTDLAASNATTACTVSSAGSPFTAADVGNGISITAGTNYTTGRYIIVSVAAGVATLDPVVCGTSASLTAGTWREGGAYPANNGTSDNTLFGGLFSASGGNRIFVKGTPTVGAATTFGGGAAQKPNIVEGYNTTRGDITQTWSLARPTISVGAFTISGGSNNQIYNLILQGSSANAANIWSPGANGTHINDKFVQPSTTAGKQAVLSTQNNTFFLGCEFISYNGVAFQTSGTSTIFGSYFHGSNVGFLGTGATAPFIIRSSLFEDNATAGVQTNIGITAYALVFGNTFYGTKVASDIGISWNTGTTTVRVANNIFNNLSTAVSHPDVNTNGYDDYNNYFGNTTDVNAVANWQKGLHDVALTPTFSNVTTTTGTNATSSTNVLTDASANFNAIGLQDNSDLVYITAITGTGSATGHYLITSHTNTSLTLSTNLTSSGSGSAINYQIVTGHNYAVTNKLLQGKGFPGALAGTTGFATMGAFSPAAGGGATVKGVVY